MQKGLPFKILLVIIILISCILLFVSVPVLIKGLFGDISMNVNQWKELSHYKTNIYLGAVTGVIVSILTLFRLEVVIQIKLVRFLLILSIMLTAISYVLLKSIS